METIVLVATRDEEQTSLGAELLRNNPQLSIVPVRRPDEFDALTPRILSASRIVAFCTDILVPRRILDAIGFGAYNFHPGSPDYPGWSPAGFAIYQGARAYGVTAHVMTDRVDSGDIIGTNLFDVPDGTGQAGLETLSYAAAVDLFQHFAPALATWPEPLPAIRTAWGPRRYTRKDHAEICTIKPDIGAEELQRRVSAFGAGPQEHRPVIKLHGFAFALLDTAAPRP